jgi:hypothetical protein
VFLFNQSKEERMDPKNKAILDEERTEELPAQERVAAGGESDLVLSAETVYAQRLAEIPLNGEVAAPAFIP